MEAAEAIHRLGETLARVNIASLAGSKAQRAAALAKEFETLCKDDSDDERPQERVATTTPTSRAPARRARRSNGGLRAPITPIKTPTQKDATPDTASAAEKESEGSASRDSRGASTRGHKISFATPAPRSNTKEPGSRMSVCDTPGFDFRFCLRTPAGSGSRRRASAASASSSIASLACEKKSPHQGSRTLPAVGAQQDQQQQAARAAAFGKREDAREVGEMPPPPPVPPAELRKKMSFCTGANDESEAPIGDAGASEIRGKSRAPGWRRSQSRSTEAPQAKAAAARGTFVFTAGGAFTAEAAKQADTVATAAPSHLAQPPPAPSNAQHAPAAFHIDELASQSAQALADAAREHYGRGDFTSALAALDAALLVAPANWPPRFTLYGGRGAALLELGRPEKAIAELEQALRAEPAMLPVRRLLGRAYLEVGRFEHAEMAFEEVLRATAMAARGSTDAANIQSAAAGGIQQVYVAKTDTDAAIAAFRCGDPCRALSLADSVLAVAPRAEEAAATRAACLAALGSAADCVEYCEMWAKGTLGVNKRLKPLEVVANTPTGMTQAYIGALRTLERFKEAIESTRALAAIGSITRETVVWCQAVTTTLEAEAATAAVITDGDNARSRGDFITAARCYSQSLGMCHAAAAGELHFRRANCMRALGRAKEALSDCDKALTASPPCAAALILRARLLASLGRRSEAVLVYSECARLFPADAAVAGELSELRAAMAAEDREQARQREEGRRQREAAAAAAAVKREAEQRRMFQEQLRKAEEQRHNQQHHFRQQQQQQQQQQQRKQQQQHQHQQHGSTEWQSSRSNSGSNHDYYGTQPKEANKGGSKGSRFGTGGFGGSGGTRFGSGPAAQRSPFQDQTNCFRAPVVSPAAKGGAARLSEDSCAAILDAARNFYDLLGVRKGSSTGSIKKAYRRLALKYHPDKSKATDTAEAFKRINEAYCVLQSPQSKSIYDEELRAKLAESSRSRVFGARRSSTWA